MISGTIATLEIGAKSQGRVERQAGIHAGIDDHRPVGHQQQRVAVRRRLGDEIAADVAVGTRAVVDHHLLAERLGEMLPDQPRQDIAGAADRKRHHHPDLALRIGRGGAGGARLRRRSRRQRDEGKAGEAGEEGAQRGGEPAAGTACKAMHCAMH